MSFRKASYPARASGSTDTVAGLSRPASRVPSSRRCGARKLAEAASPICWVARSKSKSPVIVLLEEFCDRRRLLPEAIQVAGNGDDRQRRADRDAPGYERGAARRAACLAVPAGEERAFFGDTVDVRGRMARGRSASRISAEIVPAGVIGHQHDNVGLFSWACARPTSVGEANRNSPGVRPPSSRERDLHIIVWHLIADSVSMHPRR